MQAQPHLYKSVGDGFKTIMKQEGFKGFTVGWFPTLVGYSAQGFGKFGFYEIFKDVYRGIAGENAAKYQTLGFAVSSAGAEFIADCLLCPMEALKVKMQTSDPGTFPLRTAQGINTIKAAEGMNGFYKGLSPLWARQIPYTIVKFVAFEKIVQQFYKKVFTKPKSEYSKSTQLMVTFMSGYIAGVFCAVVSHPADTMVSILNKRESSDSAMKQVKDIYGEIGFGGLWKGLGTRIFMVGTLTCLQWVIYDSFKVACGLATTGGK
uniref:Mitochondrial phosphate carrier protein n=1 Tax=Strombidium inclinatum TaxID=197538 RepID=A0A7S3IVF3_9SPIT